MKKVISYLLICVCCLGLCGCTAFPNYSEEDMDLVAEYASGLLVQYSAVSDNRLVDLEEAILTMDEIEEEKEQQEEIPEEEPEVPQEEPEVVPEDTPVIDNTEVIEETTYPINEVMGVDVLTVNCNGYEVKESYPDGSGAFFALDAGDNCKLVVVKYTLTNNTDSGVNVNMLENNVSFKVSLDGNGYQYALSTMLLDDISTYVGELAAGTSVELVLISEWKEEKISNITNPIVYIKNGELSGKYTVQ